MADQYEVVQEELDIFKAECLQFANVQLSGEHDQVIMHLTVENHALFGVFRWVSSLTRQTLAVILKKKKKKKKKNNWLLRTY